MSEKEAPDMTHWSEQDKKAYAKFGQVPKTNAFMKRALQGKDKQRFDSADFEMQKKQGKAPTGVPRVGGGAHPLGGKKAPIPDSVRKLTEGSA